MNVRREGVEGRDADLFEGWLCRFDAIHSVAVRSRVCDKEGRKVKPSMFAGTVADEKARTMTDFFDGLLSLEEE